MKVVSTSTAILVVVLATASAFAMSFLLFQPIITALADLAFPLQVSQGARGAEIYGFGLVFPYLLFLAPLSLVLGYSFVTFALERRSWMSQGVAGAVTWGLPGVLLFVVSIAQPPLSNSALNVGAVWIVCFGFAVFQTSIGAFAAIASRAMLKWFGAIR